MERILICNGAHIGDLILASAVLPVIKSTFPSSEIGFLTSSWAQVALKDHLFIDHMHTFDHPLLNRASLSRKRKKKIGAITWMKALQEIREKKYSLAIDIYSAYAQNSSSLLYYADIPFRVGYWGHRNPFFLNKLGCWRSENIHTVDRHGALMHDCGIIDSNSLKLLKPTLLYKTCAHNTALVQGEYIVIHMGVGERIREWNDPSWIDLCKKLNNDGLKLVFIGSGKRELERIEKVTAHLSNSINLAGQLQWRELLPLIKQAKLLIGLESMASHIAAAVNTPCVSIYGGCFCIERWKPYTDNCRLVVPPQDCFDARGYAPIGSIHKITSADVYSNVLAILNFCIES